ncbi:MAG TPA: hypothetical protein PK360_03005 [bacterium]|nr:hypothetical protein [bacterium]
MAMMLLASTFVIAFAVSTLIVLIFNKPITSILNHIIPPDISYAWNRYLRFAIYVVGIGGGVRVYALEKYMTLQDPYKEIVPLTTERWLLEIYETVIGTLSSVTIMLLVFFVFALIAYVIVRIFEPRVAKPEDPKPAD